MQFVVFPRGDPTGTTRERGAQRAADVIVADRERAAERDVARVPDRVRVGDRFAGSREGQ